MLKILFIQLWSCPPHTHTHWRYMYVYTCVYTYICSMQTVNTQGDAYTHTRTHDCMTKLSIHASFRRLFADHQPILARRPAPSCPASPKVHVIGLTNAICLGSRDWSRQRNVIICAHNYICLYCMHKRTNRPRIDGVSHLEPTQLRRVHVRIGSLHSHTHTKDRHEQTPPSARTKAFPISGVHT